MPPEVSIGAHGKPWHRVLAWAAFAVSLVAYPILLAHYARATLLPERFSGTVFVSNALTNLRDFPYRYFLEPPSDDGIAGSVLVFHGDFDLPEVAAERRVALFYGSPGQRFGRGGEVC